MFLMFLAQVAAAPPARPPKLVPIFSYQDYPAEALRRHWEGTVVAEISISADGNPTACRIVKSSGHQILDDTTCNCVMQRAKFKPTGKEDTYTTPSIGWHIR